MNLVKRKVISRFVLFILLWGVSCRGTANSENIDEGTTPGNTAVIVRLHQTEFDGELSTVAGKKVPSQATTKTIKQEVLLDPSTITTVEMTLTSAPITNTDQKIAGLNPQAVVSGASLPNGTKYRIIAYRKNNGSYHTHEDYTVGDQNPPEMLLSHGTEYEIVAYTFNKSSLPVISDSEKTTINNANIAYSASDINNGFLYQKINSFTPVYGGNNNTLDIVLRHKIAQITTIVNSAALTNITDVSAAVIGSHFTSGTIKLSDANIARSNQSTQSLAFVNPPAPSSEWAAVPRFVNSAAQISFSAQVTIGTVMKPISINTTDPQFAVKPGYKQTFTIKFGNKEVRCGAYLGPMQTLWRNFMCYNLGVTNPNTDVKIPNKESHGARYRYGAKTNQQNFYLSQSDDQNSVYNSIISGWGFPVDPVGVWTENSKSNDPCPVGYRIPTKDEWKAVLDNNVDIFLSPTNWNNDVNNYSSYIRFNNDNGKALLALPATGYRIGSTGKLESRGYSAAYWSSSIDNKKYVTFSMSSLHIGVTNQEPQDSANPIRCIAEK